jgi:hypothetical protein
MRKANSYVDTVTTQNEGHSTFRRPSSGSQLYNQHSKNNPAVFNDCRYTIVDLGPPKDVCYDGSNDSSADPASDAESADGICGSEVGYPNFIGLRRKFLNWSEQISCARIGNNGKSSYRIFSKISPWAYFFQPLARGAYFRGWAYNREWAYFRENTVSRFYWDFEKPVLKTRERFPLVKNWVKNLVSCPAFCLVFALF